MDQKPFSQACENNKQPIAEVLQRYLNHPGKVLEIGSGTGQHGHYFSGLFDHLHWQPSDRRDNLAYIQQWVDDAQRENYSTPFALDVNEYQPDGRTFDGIFSANTAHIMSWDEVKCFFALIPQLLNEQGWLFLYGPFNYDGQYTSSSNARFDDWLKSQASHQSIRDFEAVNTLANAHHLELREDVAMPANNRTLVWQFCPKL